MTAVIDTNILFSALISPSSYPGYIYQAWLDDVFELITSEEQIQELRLSSRSPRARHVLKAYDVGFTINRCAQGVFM